uniref:THAP-type domain-containing protein n=1 Tax=Sparus aurata TaxID=8175 RepID=A0A671UNX2_SPAAU
LETLCKISGDEHKAALFKLNYFISPHRFHRFPIDPEVRAQWLFKIRRYSPTQNTRLCSRHFQTGDLDVTAGGQRRLNKGAVPSLFAWNDYTIPAPRLNVWDLWPRCPSPGIATSDSDSEMEVQVAPDHDYCVTPMTSVMSDEMASENEALEKKVQESLLLGPTSCGELQAALAAGAEEHQAG